MHHAACRLATGLLRLPPPAVAVAFGLLDLLMVGEGGGRWVIRFTQWWRSKHGVRRIMEQQMFEQGAHQEMQGMTILMPAKLQPLSCQVGISHTRDNLSKTVACTWTAIRVAHRSVLPALAHPLVDLDMLEGIWRQAALEPGQVCPCQGPGDARQRRLESPELAGGGIESSSCRRAPLVKGAGAVGLEGLEVAAILSNTQHRTFGSGLEFVAIVVCRSHSLY